MKKALIVGINYTGTGYDLRGCLNDAANVKSLLADKGFDSIDLVTEQQATTDGIKAALARLTSGAMPGDVLVFHYSGHGSQVASATESDGYDEIICPYDLDWKTQFITDTYLRSTFDAVPNGVNVTVVLDSCFSGTGLDQASTMRSITVSSGGKAQDNDSRSRYVAPPAEVQELIAKRAALALDPTSSRDVDTTALLIASASDTQEAADARIDGVYQGAGTYALTKYIRATDKPTYRDAVLSMNQYMRDTGFSQTPELNGPTNLYNQIVFQPWDLMLPPAPPAPAPAPVAPTPAPAPVVEEDSNKLQRIVLSIAFIAFAAFMIYKLFF